MMIEDNLDNLDPDMIEFAEQVAALTRAMILKADPNGDTEDGLLRELEGALGELENTLGEIERGKDD